MLAPMWAVLRCAAQFRNTGAIAYISDMRILCNIAHGSPRSLDAGTLVFASHLRLAWLSGTFGGSELKVSRFV